MKAFLLSAFTCLAFTLFAQGGLDDVVYLKNGSIIRGMIVEQVPGVSLKVKTLGGSIIDCRLDDIAKITKEEPPPGAGKWHIDSATMHHYAAMPEMGGYFGSAANAYTTNGTNQTRTRLNFYENFFTADLIQGLQINRIVFAGAGTGFALGGTQHDPVKNEYYITDSYVRDLLIPVFADIRITPAKTRLSPFLDVRPGYSFYIPVPRAKAQGYGFITGAMVQLNAGLRVFTTRKTAINIMIGYTLQHLEIPAEYLVTIENTGNEIESISQYTKTKNYRPYFLNAFNAAFGFCFW